MYNPVYMCGPICVCVCVLYAYVCVYVCGVCVCVYVCGVCVCLYVFGMWCGMFVCMVSVYMVCMCAHVDTFTTNTDARTHANSRCLVLAKDSS